MISYVYYDALQRRTANATIYFLNPFNPEFNNEFITQYIVVLAFPKKYGGLFNPLKPEFTIVIFIHYKPRSAVAILGL